MAQVCGLLFSMAATVVFSLHDAKAADVEDDDDNTCSHVLMGDWCFSLLVPLRV